MGVDFLQNSVCDMCLRYQAAFDYSNLLLFLIMNPYFRAESIQQKQYRSIKTLQFYFMERLELKQLEKLKEAKEEKRRKQMEVVSRMLEDDYVSTVFNYCKKILMQPLTENLSDYSPSHLSKFLFDEQLEKAKTIFESFPDQQGTIQHFMLLMISIMKFPFEKWPYYLVGVKDMFNQILAQKDETITYQSFFKYVIGEVLDFKEEQQNTEFQVRFEELKKQDYLLHDNGVKKFYYSTDTKYYMTLDESSPVIKFYNKDMRNVHKFTPNKQKHNKKYPNILHFDYSEMTSRLGIVLSDSTFSIINLHNYLTKSKYDFELNANNEVVIQFEDKVLQVYYIQMINKWVLVNDMNKMFTFDMEKYKQNDPQYQVEIKLENPDLKINYVLELVNLSMICVVAGNEVYFFNENFSELKHSKFVHGTNVKIFRYCQQLGLFYLCGDEKYITVLTLVKATDSFQIRTFDIQSKYEVCTFDVFPIVGTIVAVDKNHDVRLFDIAQGTCYQLANYSNIVKKQNGQIKMLKVSKTEFTLYETYTLVFHQEKIAIEKDTQFSFLSNTYYDEAKEEFYVSVNNQIISFSVFQGQIRKSFNLETANVPKHDGFILGKETNLFIIDHEKYIYQAYLKDNAIDGENKNYKKKIGVSHVIGMFYDEDISYAFVVGQNTIHSVRNDKLNNFSVNSVLNMQKMPEICSARYNNHQKYILAMTVGQSWYTIDVQSYKLLDYYSYKFPIDPNNHEDIMVEHFEQDEYFNIDIILNNRNEIYFLSREDRNLKMCLKIQDSLPYKLKNLQFKNMRYCQIPRTNKKYIMLSDKTGFLIEINVSHILSKYFKQTEKERKCFKFPVKDLHNLEYGGENPVEINLTGTKVHALDKKDVTLFKGHDKQIKILAKINVEGIRSLTISTDGHIKLWEQQEMLFHLKFPDLKKIAWNMQKIQKIKNERSVNEVVTVMNKISTLLSAKTSPEVLLKKNTKLKNLDQNKEVKKFNINEPIQIEIDNKDLEQFVNKTQNINWYSFKTDSKKKERENSFTQRATNYHPWRTKQEFRHIMEKASPENKYDKKMPLDLVNLRNSLDMKDKAVKTSRQYQGELTILPEINAYIPEKRNFSVREKQQSQTDANENQQAFESCLYIKKNKDRKKINEFDEIDKQFKKKWLALTAKKWIPRSDNKKKPEADKSSLGKTKIQQQKKLYYAPVNMTKYDPVKQVKSIFENYNRQASLNKKGRLIKIPDIKLKREDLFSND